ncbi:MAG: nicotinate-nucleotide adenylyltransferase [Lachnospiraceae bacterium]|nr:nicotinate-nucleotide adenylyltransferase [Lachnospiraceae bacterium]
MGGTFNPIHNGHLTLAKEAFKQFNLDEVLFMPCGVPYMKADQKVESGQIRAEMTALAIQDIPAFTLSTIEIKQQGNTYTYETLEYLKNLNPDTEYFFIVGADSLFHMTKWRYPERIFANCCILAAVRDDKTIVDMERQIRKLKREYNAEIQLLQITCMDISSSDIRRKVNTGASIEHEVPESVRDYIEKKGLYR